LGLSARKLTFQPPKPNPQKGASVLNRTFCSKGGGCRSTCKHTLWGFRIESLPSSPQAYSPKGGICFEQNLLLKRGWGQEHLEHILFGAVGSKANLPAPKPNHQKGCICFEQNLLLQRGWVQEHLQTYSLKLSDRKLTFQPPSLTPQKGASVLNRTFHSKGVWVQGHLETYSLELSVRKLPSSPQA
jgi:hypothetical protein